MAEKTTEEILDSWFFPDPMAKGPGSTAPPEAIQKRDELRKTWLPVAMADKNEAPVVKLTPVFKTQPTGWKVETAVRTKPNTIFNKTPFKNN